MPKSWTVLITAALLATMAPTPGAQADIYQWEYINPANPGLGKQPSSMLAPDGAGVNAAPAANLSTLDLTKAFLAGSFLHDANLSSATLAHADFSTGSIDFYYVSQGLTTYLTGANLSHANLTNADFAGFDQYGPEGEYYPYMGANLEGANLSGADTRGASFYLATWNDANTSNMILTNGHIAGLGLTAGKSLIVRDYDGIPFFAPIVIEHELTMDATSTLRLEFDADPWDSTISFTPGIPVALGGTLELSFAAGVDPITQLGRTIDLFDWTGVTPTGAFTVASGYNWNLSSLYTNGEVTLLAIPGFLPGDYDGDSEVNLADYTVWRDNLGAPAGTLPNDIVGGVIGAMQYDLWRSNFGQTAAAFSNASISGTVPEPTSFAIIGLALASLLPNCRRRASW
jgi:uncharacterized protein YjbI with pentapeptide repeats